MFRHCAGVLWAASLVFLGTGVAGACAVRLYRPGAASDTSSYAYGINSSNEVTGTYLPASGGHYAYVWSPGFGRATIPALNGGTVGIGFAINNNGTVVGISSASSGGNQGFYWTPTVANGSTGTLTNVGSIMPGVNGASRLLAINNLGQTVGLGSVSGTNAGFYWDGVSVSAQAINGPVVRDQQRMAQRRD